MPAWHVPGGMARVPPTGVAACHGVTTSFYPIPFSKTEHKHGTVPFLKFFRTEHRVGTIPCPRNETIPFRPPRFQNRTHPKFSYFSQRSEIFSSNSLKYSDSSARHRQQGGNGEDGRCALGIESEEKGSLRLLCPV
jgi:hypothetical protein